MEENKTHQHNHNERVYSRGIDRLRSVERVERMEVDRIISLCMEEKINSVLDIGTGSALFADAFFQHGIKVGGIDINHEMIKAAKQYVPEGDFKVAPAEEIPFKDCSFDATFFGVVFHEVDDYLKALNEAFRVSLSGTYILEWKYKQEDFGPPIEHRLKPEFIKKLSTEAGYKNFKVIELKNLVLYKLIK